MRRRKEAEVVERRGVEIFKYGLFPNLQFHLYVLHFKLTGDDEKREVGPGGKFSVKKVSSTSNLCQSLANCADFFVFNAS